MYIKRTLKTAALVAAAMLFCGCGGGSSKYEASFFVMDTTMTFTVRGDLSAGREACEGLGRTLREYEKLWSVTIDDSEISRANRGEAVRLSPETEELVSLALDIGGQTDGALDITIYPVLREWGFTTRRYNVPDERRTEELLRLTGSDKVSLEDGVLQLSEGTQIDLGAVAKGYLGDIISERFRDHGVTSALLDLGGNIHAIGANPDGSPWRLGIRSPFEEGNIAVLEVTDKAAVTSGGYERYFEQGGERYCHILDPSTGRPADSGLASVTIVGEEGALCDALSTAVYVMGAAAAEELWRSHGGFDMVLIHEDGHITVTEGIADSLTPTFRYEGEVEVLSVECSDNASLMSCISLRSMRVLSVELLYPPYGGCYHKRFEYCGYSADCDITNQLQSTMLLK